MDYSKSLPNPDGPGFPANLKPVRHRFQRFTPKTRFFFGGGVKRGSHDATAANDHHDNKGDSPLVPREMNIIGTGPAATSFGHNPFADEPVLPLPPDLSDSKWLDYIERSGLMFHEPTVTEDVPKPMRKQPPPIIPELAHLARVEASRPSLDSNSSGSVPNSASTISTMRRKAKTPVFRIGQLEGKVTPGTRYGRDPWIAEKTSSVELIAQQYCALLEHRDALEEEREREEEKRRNEKMELAEVSSIYTTSSVYTAHQSEPTMGRSCEEFVVPRKPLPTRYSSEDSPANIILEPVRNSTVRAQHSPSSTNGTYVGPHDSAIYFKPVSFSHGPPAAQATASDEEDDTLRAPAPAPAPPTSSSSPYSDPVPNDAPDSLSLQICLDLLTKELASAFTGGGAADSGNNGSALQVWVMIEAYERLQDRVACTEELGEAQRQKMQRVFRSWLGALYALHDVLLAKAAKGVDEREVESLAVAVD